MAGPGRPKKSEKYGGHIVAAEDRIAQRLDKILDNLFALADGVTVQEETKDGGTRIYTEPPDFKTNEYLANRILGKPTERIEHTGEDGGPLEVDATVRDAAAIELESWRREMTARLARIAALPPPG